MATSTSARGSPVAATMALALPATISPTVRSATTPATRRASPAKAKPKRRKRAPKFVWRQRDAQDSRFYNLQLDINDVKQHIQELTQYRAMLYARTLEATPAALVHTQQQPCAFVRTVHEYMRVFRHGLNPAPPEVDVVAFLHGIMAHDVWINEFRGGIDMILSQWGIYAACFDHIDLACIQSIALPIHDPCGRDGFVVRALGNYTARITHNTIAIMFPHVLRFPRLATRLIGQELHGRSHYDFVFDCQSNRILRCDVSVDFVGAFAKLLPDPRDLSIVFNGAKLESDFYLGEADESVVAASSGGDEEKPFKEVPPGSPRSVSQQEMRDVECANGTSPTNKMDLHHILS